MKKTLVVFLSTLFIVCLVGVSLAQEMNIDTKWRIYNAESKNPWLAVGAAWLLPDHGSCLCRKLGKRAAFSWG